MNLMRYRATHRSTCDGSEAMLLDTYEDGTYLLVNENGDEWVDLPLLWEAV